MCILLALLYVSGLESTSNRTNGFWKVDEINITENIAPVFWKERIFGSFFCKKGVKDSVWYFWRACIQKSYSYVSWCLHLLLQQRMSSQPLSYSQKKAVYFRKIRQRKIKGGMFTVVIIVDHTIMRGRPKLLYACNKSREIDVMSFVQWCFGMHKFKLTFTITVHVIKHWLYSVDLFSRRRRRQRTIRPTMRC